MRSEFSLNNFDCLDIQSLQRMDAITVKVQCPNNTKKIKRTVYTLPFKRNRGRKDKKNAFSPGGFRVQGGV